MILRLFIDVAASDNNPKDLPVAAGSVQFLAFRLKCQIMKSPEHLKPLGGRFNLTPMIDVVFLLIIFFIVSNNMIQQDNAVTVDLPEAETGMLPQEQQTKRLTISISEPGTLYAGAEPVDKGRLRQLMTACRNDWGEEMEVQIRTHKDVPYGEIKPVLRMMAESGIVHVSFAVKKRPL
jgi:biopolymer transport protein ExbD